eukprot:6178453-Pleurochrysis_carterae.AAC.3
MWRLQCRDCAPRYSASLESGSRRCASTAAQAKHATRRVDAKPPLTASSHGAASCKDLRYRGG